MNVLLTTPILNTKYIRRKFDNQIIMFFVVLISVLALIVLLFFDLTATLRHSIPTDKDNPQNSTLDSTYT